MDFDVATLVSALDDSPCGEEPSSLLAYDELLLEIKKLEGIEKVDLNWSKIATTCQALLLESTKDLRVANILAYAHFQLHHWQGLAEGFELLKALITSDYASELFPKRKSKQNKARAATFVWLTAKLDKHFSINEITHPAQLDGAEQAILNFNSMQEALKDYLEDQTPPFSEINTLFKRFLVTIEEEKTKNEAVAASPDASPEQAVETPHQAPQTVAKPAAAPAPPPNIAQVTTANPGDITKTLNAASSALKSVAGQLSAQNPFSANAFYLARVSKWMLIQELPANDVLDKQPNEQSIKNMQNLEAANNHMDLLRSAEQEFNNGAIFCLALHRYVYNALVGLGQQDVADVVLSCTTNFVVRFPKILETNFKGNEPFVDEMTKTWLNSSLTSDANDGNAIQSSISDEGSEPWLDAKAAAIKLIATGKTKEAVTLFQEGIDKATTVKSLLMWRYELAILLSKTGNNQLVLMQLQHIQECLNDTVASKWEPGLYTNVLRLMLNSHKKLQEKNRYEPDMLEKLQALKHEMVLLSPADALEFIET